VVEETTVQLVQRQLEAYNARDIDAFAACFAPDVRLEDLDGDRVLGGYDAVIGHYRALFAGNPGLRASLLDRIAVGKYVVDEELVDGRADGRTLHVVAIYRVVDGLIASVRLIH
jgi:hypothetical protein